MPTNEIITFAAASNANVAAQAEYAADAATPTGYTQGVARSKFVNKVLRQVTLVCSAFAQFVAEQSGQDVLDDGDAPGLKAKILLAIRAAAAAPVGTLWMGPVSSAPAGYLKANGAAISVATYSALAAAIYVGDALNASAAYGYKCNDPLNPSVTRSTTGAYIVLPDARGEFLRGFDDGRNVDGGRTLGSWQGATIINTGLEVSGGQSNIQIANADSVTQVQPNGAAYFLQDNNTTPRISNTVRPRNLAMLICIKY